MSEQNNVLDPDGPLVKTFFGSDRTSFKGLLEQAVASPFVDSIMLIKDNFDSEKNKKGGCSACRLRALTRKYKPTLISALAETQKKD